VLGQQRIVGLGQYVDDGIADSGDVKGSVVHW
jgi:hypothetical protein